MKQNQRGFTLIEMVVVMAISMIILGISASALFNTDRTYQEHVDLQLAKQIGDNLFQFSADKLRYATKLQLLPEHTPQDQWKYGKAILTREHRLYYRKSKDSTEEDLFGDGFYRGMEMKTFGEIKTDWLLTLRVEIYFRGDLLYFTESDIKIINFDLLEGAGIDGKLGKRLENPIFCFDDGVGVKGTILTPTTLYMQMKTSMEDYQAMMNDYRSLAYNDPRKEELEQEICNKFGITNMNLFGNDQCRDYVRNTYYGGSWPVLTMDVQPFAFDPKDKSKYSLAKYEPGSLILQAHIDSDQKSILVYAVPATENPNGHYGWSAELIYNYQRDTWYTYYPTVISQKSDARQQDFNFAQMRTDDQFYQMVAEKWNPLT